MAALEARLADPGLAASVLTGGTPEEDVLLRVLQWSLNGLPAERVAEWQALALAPGDFGLWTVQALWGEADPVGGLRELVRRNLVTRLEGQERWRLHDILRRFALAAVQAGPEREQTLWRQLGPAAAVRLREIEIRFSKGHDDMVPALAELDAELPLLRAVQEWAAERIEADAVAAEVASRLPHVTVVDFRLTNAENMLWFQAALLAAEHRGEKAEIARAAGNLGLVHLERGEWEEALTMLNRVREIAEGDDDKVNMARTYCNLGLVQQERGEWEEALAMHRKSLAIEEELGNRAGMAAEYGNLGAMHQERGEWEEAEKALHQCISIFEELGDRAGIARNVCNLGSVLKDKDDWAGAAEHFRRSLALAEELGMPLAETIRQALAEAEAYLAGGKGSA